MVDSRWRKLVKKGASRGFFDLNTNFTIKNMKKKLTAKNEKLRKLKMFGRWRILCNGLLQRYPDEKVAA